MHHSHKPGRACGPQEAAPVHKLAASLRGSGGRVKSPGMDVYHRARELIDAAHGADPKRAPDGRAAELVYGERVEAWVARLVLDARPVLRLAARCQHLERWRVPRTSFPEGKVGYLKWRQSPQAVAELQAKQRAILDSAARLLKPGGRLVYATCSLLRAENEEVAEAFGAAHPEFAVLPAETALAAAHVADAASLVQGPFLRLWPHRHGTDGFFAAAWQRQ